MTFLKKIALFIWSGWLFCATQALACLFAKAGLLRAARVSDSMSGIKIVGVDVGVKCYYALGFFAKLINISLIGGTAAVAFPGVIVFNLSAVIPGKLHAIWRHECEHERQWASLGVLFMPCYLVASLIALLRGEGWYKGNYFEAKAKDAAFRRLTPRR